MISKLKYTHALYCLHILLYKARFRLATEHVTREVVDILDYAEMLPRFIAGSEDNTSEFRSYLKVIAAR